MYYILFILDSSAVLAGQGNRCFPYPVAFTIKTRQKIRRRTRNIVRILGSDYVTQWDGNGLSFGKAMTESVSCFATTTGSFIAPYLAVSDETRRRAISSACWLSCDSWPPPKLKNPSKKNRIWKGNGYKMKRDEFSVLSTGRVLWMNLKNSAPIRNSSLWSFATANLISSGMVNIL